jgi:N-acetylglucosamine-6-phosphate deacetylase
MLTALYNAQIVSGGKLTAGNAVIVKNNQIQSVIPADAIPSGMERVDLQGAYLAPGLIDLQIYGAGHLFFGGNPSVAALQEMEHTLLRQGTTSFFATVATNSPDVVLQAIEAAKVYRPEAIGCFLGLHLEGPYLNPVRKGAHPEKYIKKATLSEVQQWVELAQGEIKMMTLAPELQDEDVLEYLQQQNIIVSMGHSNASYAEAKQFLNHQVRAVTHLYNAMQPMHHRDVGMIPAIFEEKPYTSIVADGIHVDYAMIRLAKRELGDKLFFITDAVTETTEGTYPHRLAGDRYVMPDGTLSGSALTMLKAVQNGVSNAGLTIPEAVDMATLYPSQLAGLTTKGKVEAGYDADFIIFDAEFNLQSVFYNGKAY